MAEDMAGLWRIKSTCCRTRIIGHQLLVTAERQTVALFVDTRRHHVDNIRNRAGVSGNTVLPKTGFCIDRCFVCPDQFGIIFNERGHVYLQEYSDAKNLTSRDVVIVTQRL